MYFLYFCSENKTILELKKQNNELYYSIVFVGGAKMSCKFRFFASAASLFLCIVALFLPSFAVAQTDYSGVYYIKNNTTEYYLVPAANPQQADNKDAYFSSNTNGNNYLSPGDPLMPFLTTYKTGGDLNSVWLVLPSGTSGQYFIVHALTGKYLVYEPPHSNALNRKSVHLVDVDEGSYNPGTNANFRFEITANGSYFNIRPVSLTSGNRYLNPAGNNNDYYYGLSSPLFHQGLVGVYSAADGNSLWTFVDASAATGVADLVATLKPTLTRTVDCDNNVVFTCANHPAAKIYYTTDGSTPTDASTLYAGPFVPADGVTLKGIAILGFLQSDVTVAYVYHTTYTTAPAIVLGSTSATVAFDAGQTLYYTTDGSDPADADNAARTTYSGSSPLVISVSEAADVYIRLVAQSGGLEVSCIESTVRRAKQPVVSHPDLCTEKFSLSGTESGRTYWYAWSIGQNQPAPDTSAAAGNYVQYTPGSEIELRSLAGVAIGTEYVTLHAFSVVDADGVRSSVASVNHQMKYTPVPTIRLIVEDDVAKAAIAAVEDATIKYSIDGSEPSMDYTGHVSLPDGVATTVKAKAKYGSLEYSCVVTVVLTPPQRISTLAELQAISDHLDYSYMLVADIDASSLSTSINNFSGTFDGGFHTISGLTVPLFDVVQGGTIKNVVLDAVQIDRSAVTDGQTGALANQLAGASKVYNCGVLKKSDTSYVVGYRNVGGLIGHIQSTSSARVVNCYSYATVKSVGTGNEDDYAAGVVGKINGTAGARVANCIMYGDIADDGVVNKISPVYGGTHVSNDRNFTEYNYYRYRAHLNYTHLKDQQAIQEDRYLTRFPFYRHILNTHRTLASYFLFDDYDELHVSELGHWVLRPDIAPYPIVEAERTNTRYATEEIAANLPSTTENYAGRKLTELGTDGMLAVTVKIGSNTYNVNLPITDMDTLRYDFTWGKVVLPFVNEFSGWERDYDSVCTGWKITAVDGETSFEDPGNYNFADRSKKKKDIYHSTNNPYIFAQGGNYIVPYGVKSITIKANFAPAYYLSDPSYDIAFSSTFSLPTEIGGSVPNTYHGKPVYTSLNALEADLSVSSNPHSQAIVLVGNYHYYSTASQGAPDGFGKTKAVTVMSADEDANQDPDYGFYVRFYGRVEVPPLRWDFVPLIDIGMAAHVNNASNYPCIGIWRTKGWFETTETALTRMDQCEIEDGKFAATENGHGNNRWIANSGLYTQIVRTKETAANRLSYLQIGGNAYVKELYPGSHSDGGRTTTLRPVLVTGGEVEQCFMTGYNSSGKAAGSDIYFWCAGGRIHKYLSAYMEEPNTSGVNVTAKVDHAVIRRFFGGGTSSAAEITGNISVTMDNSLCDFYCGGPEFGDMSSGKTVTTVANNTVFGEYYGAGFGGTSITYVRKDQNDNLAISPETPFPTAYSTVYDRLGVNAKYGLGVTPKFEYIIHSGGFTLVARSFTGYARFSLATTGNVTNTLTGCTVLRNFYGGGCQGKVNGSITSTLTDCNVVGSAYGAGYKAENNSLEVYTAVSPAYSVYYRESAIFTDFDFSVSGSGSETYTWKEGTADTYNEGSKELYTNVEIGTLGTVTGSTTITVGGTSRIGGDLYGAGDESNVQNNTLVTVQGSSTIGRNIFGGGNAARVGVNTEVRVFGKSKIYGNVYGGGNMGEVGGDTKVIVNGTEM